MKNLKIKLVLVIFICMNLLSFSQKKDIISYENGKLNGKYVEYYENGNKKVEGVFKNNLRIGNWKVWDEKGKLIMEREYYNSVLIRSILSFKKVIEYDSIFEGKFRKLRESDVLWSKRVWRKIENDSLNSVMFKDKFLQNVIKNGIKKNKLIVYKTNKLDKIIEGENLDKILKNINSVSCEFILKEDWFFNKTNEQMEFRYIGISFVKENNELCAVYFPEFRDLLADGAFNNKKDFFSIIEFFSNREFNSTIIKESSLNHTKVTPKRAKEIELQIFKTEHEFWLKND